MDELSSDFFVRKYELIDFMNIMFWINVDEGMVVTI